MGKISFEGLSIGEKFDVILNQFESIQKRLDKIKPECFLIEEKSTEPITPREPLGDFWVCLKDADNYYWSEYAYEDFVIGLWGCDANKVRHSGSAENRNVGYPKEFYGVSPNKTEHWSFGSGKPIPEWFTQENIDNGRIWVKPLCVHDYYEAPDANEDYE